MKLDTVFLWELAKVLAIWGFAGGATWAACGLAATWGLPGIAMLLGLAFFVAAVYVANLRAKEIRFSRKIKP